MFEKVKSTEQSRDVIMTQEMRDSELDKCPLDTKQNIHSSI